VNRIGHRVIMCMLLSGASCDLESARRLGNERGR
jgi:hypothetical protein